MKKIRSTVCAIIALAALLISKETLFGADGQVVDDMTAASLRGGCTYIDIRDCNEGGCAGQSGSMPTFSPEFQPKADLIQHFECTGANGYVCCDCYDQPIWCDG